MIPIERADHPHDLEAGLEPRERAPRTRIGTVARCSRLSNAETPGRGTDPDREARQREADVARQQRADEHERRREHEQRARHHLLFAHAPDGAVARELPDEPADGGRRRRDAECEQVVLERNAAKNARKPTAPAQHGHRAAGEEDARLVQLLPFELLLLLGLLDPDSWDLRRRGSPPTTNTTAANRSDQSAPNSCCTRHAGYRRRPSPRSR